MERRAVKHSTSPSCLGGFFWINTNLRQQQMQQTVSSVYPHQSSFLCLSKPPHCPSLVSKPPPLPFLGSHIYPLQSSTTPLSVHKAGRYQLAKTRPHTGQSSAVHKLKPKLKSQSWD